MIQDQSPQEIYQGPRTSLTQAAEDSYETLVKPGDGTLPKYEKNMVPQKFWDNTTNSIRLEALLKSYIELEKKLGEKRTFDVPCTPDAYEINIKSDFLKCDADLNRRLHAANFTQEQAQLVYDLASEYLAPMVAEIACAYEMEGQVAGLVKHFGGEDRWREVARQIDTWGRSHLPEHVFEALSTTRDGILTMYRMMSNGEPGLIKGSENSREVMSEAQLRAMMRDPKYWRDREPSTVSRVRDGFRALYGE